MYYSSIANTEQYNQALNSDLGSEMMSYYIELGYNVLKPFRKFNAQLIPFVRYENYNTHHGVSGTIIKNEAFDRQVITAGLTWKLNPNVALKTDLQWINNKANTTYLKAFNAGIGLMF